MARDGRDVSGDVINSEGALFEDLLLAPPLLEGLRRAGFLRPSPVQLASIPLGRFGADLVVQAKSGTGKTVAFATICIENVKLGVAQPQALVLAPTREIALQIREVFVDVCACLPAPLDCAVFVGGLPVGQDEHRLRSSPCHVVVGTPGRIRALLETGALQASSVRMFVLDEADRLLEEGAFDGAVQWIHKALPQRKQIMAWSATYSQDLLSAVEALMREPQHIMLSLDESAPQAVCQYFLHIPDAELTADANAAKEHALMRTLDTVSFHQAIVFCTNPAFAEGLTARVSEYGFPAAFISGALDQRQRMGAMASVRGLRLRVLVSTDLTARGVDLEHVNVVINLDLPKDDATYLHRIGRTGRFGTHGIAVSFVNGEELDRLRKLQEQHNMSLQPLPDILPSTQFAYELTRDSDHVAFQELLQASQAKIDATLRKREEAALPPMCCDEHTAAVVQNGYVVMGHDGDESPLLQHEHLLYSMNGDRAEAHFDPPSEQLSRMSFNLNGGAESYPSRPSNATSVSTSGLESIPETSTAPPAPHSEQQQQDARQQIHDEYPNEPAAAPPHAASTATTTDSHWRGGGYHPYPPPPPPPWLQNGHYYPPYTLPPWPPLAYYPPPNPHYYPPHPYYHPQHYRPPTYGYSPPPHPPPPWSFYPPPPHRHWWSTPPSHAHAHAAQAPYATPPQSTSSQHFPYLSYQHQPVHTHAGAHAYYAQQQESARQYHQQQQEYYATAGYGPSQQGYAADDSEPQS